MRQDAGMRLDHVSYATEPAHLADTVQRIGAAVGGTFVDGGLHPRFGTRNFVLPLQGGCYVEVVAALDHPAADKHVWEHNNLAQKNLTIVDLLPNTFIIIPVVIRHVFSEGFARYELEVWRDKALPDYDVSLVHTSKKFFGLCRDGKISRLGNERKGSMPRRHGHSLDCGGHMLVRDGGRDNSLLTSDHPNLIAQRFPDAVQIAVPAGTKAHVPVDLSLFSQHMIGVKVAVPSRAKNGAVMTTHFVQRHVKSKQITGGIAIQVRVNRHPALRL